MSTVDTVGVMKPHGAGGGPGAEAIRKMVAEGLSAMDIAQRYGVSRGSAENWLRRAGVAPLTGSRLRHDRLLPWRPLAPEHTYHPIAKALRLWSREMQGGTLTEKELQSLRRLRDFITPRDLVVQYSEDEGFTLVPRDPAIDDPELPIRRPA